MSLTITGLTAEAAHALLLRGCSHRYVLHTRDRVSAIAAQVRLSWPIDNPSGPGGWIWHEGLGDPEQALRGSRVVCVGGTDYAHNPYHPASVIRFPDVFSAAQHLLRLSIPAGRLITEFESQGTTRYVSRYRTEMGRVGDERTWSGVPDSSHISITLTTGESVVVPPNYANAWRSVPRMSETKRAIARQITEHVERVGAPGPFPITIVAAIGWRESRLTPDAEGPPVRGNRAAGAFQLMPSVYQPAGIDPFQYMQAVPVVLRILSRGIAQATERGLSGFEAMTWALERYAIGPSVATRGVRRDGPMRAATTLDIARRVAEVLNRR